MPVISHHIKLHKVQLAFRQSAAIYKGFVGGIGSGKSWVGAYDLIRRAKPKRLYMAVAPTYVMMRDASLRTFLDIARSLHYLKDFQRGEMLAVLGNGAEVLFRSADNPDRLRGPNLSGVWLDEASLMPEEAFTVMVGRLREQGEQGWLSASFTPKGRSHWTYTRFAMGGPGVELFHSSTRTNPFLPDDFYTRLKEVYPGPLGRQELEGEFVDVEGAEWPASYFPDDIWFRDWPTDLVVKTIGIDPSKGKDAKHGDYSAFVLLGRCREGKLWLEAHLDRINAESIIERALGYQRDFHADVIAVESNQFQELLAVWLAKEARKQGMPLPVVPVVNTVNKDVRIRRLGPYLAQRVFRFRDTPGTRLLVQQMRDWPEGEHDDGPDCAEIALRAMIDLWNGRLKRRPSATYNRVMI